MSKFKVGDVVRILTIEEMRALPNVRTSDGLFIEADSPLWAVYHDEKILNTYAKDRIVKIRRVDDRNSEIYLHTEKFKSGEYICFHSDVCVHAIHFQLRELRKELST